MAGHQAVGDQEGELPGHILGTAHSAGMAHPPCREAVQDRVFARGWPHLAGRSKCQPAHARGHGNWPFGAAELQFMSSIKNPHPSPAGRRHDNAPAGDSPSGGDLGAGSGGFTSALPPGEASVLGLALGFSVLPHWPPVAKIARSFRSCMATVLLMVLQDQRTLRCKSLGLTLAKSAPSRSTTRSSVT